MSNTKQVKEYYRTRESRIGYMLFLRGAKHFGYYDKRDVPVGFQRALRKMERNIGNALGLKQAAKVLDAGCDMGIVSRNLARCYSYDITGIDLLDFNLKRQIARLKSLKIAI